MWLQVGGGGSYCLALLVMVNIWVFTSIFHQFLDSFSRSLHLENQDVLQSSTFLLVAPIMVCFLRGAACIRQDAEHFTCSHLITAIWQTRRLKQGKLNNLQKLINTHSKEQGLIAVSPWSTGSQAGGPSAEFHSILKTVLQNWYFFYFYLIFERSVFKKVK